ncbi:TIGR03619 family F420-dependent LLM class oxidoreductase [uncultured Nocardioides sp.]|uniref:TIGR03619 family F420-dependent LLM class oxidoreductase n=1 Tax=uncultured Nocardioides sp. TaxID=198441 RepID=UPI0026078E61|nr:TIGR03619 family F420-dependent LLM class oxidoreductase [uncultured Nocardioides sp.]
MSVSSPLLGFGLPVSGAWATPDRMVHVARRAEELGYASLWTFQRLLYPVEGGLDPAFDRRENPGTRAADDPSYQQVHDPLLPLAYVASHTERIGLGTATICAPFIAPVVMAKAAATLDHLTGGRLAVGLGIGWMPHEYEAAGVPFERRGARMEEYLRCLTALWTDDPVSFDGEFYTVPPSHTGLAPLQDPHPPLLIGGSAPAALRRAGRLAQGWIGSSKQDLTTIAASVEHVRAGAREAGRDPDAVRILVRGLVDVTESDAGADRRPLQGSADQVREDLAALAAQGVTEVFVDLNFDSRVGAPHLDPDAATAEAERVLDALAPRP